MGNAQYDMERLHVCLDETLAALKTMAEHKPEYHIRWRINELIINITGMLAVCWPPAKK